MARKKCTLSTLGDAIADILKEYEGEVVDKTQEITAAVTKKGANALRNESLSMFNNVDLPRGRYGTGWTSQVETGRFSAQGTIYNAKYPGLPHLLENGHANRNGGRTPGRVHIKPVEDMVTQEYIRKVEANL
jgi:hypothetical protein